MSKTVVMKIRLVRGAVVKLLMVAGALFCFGHVNAQSEAASKTMPPFRILLTSMKYLKAADLDKVTPKMILYFDPTCDHCKAFTKDILLHKNDFGKTQIIMITFAPVDQVKKFAADFDLGKYSNISVGTEGYTFIVQKYYNIQKFPFTALFDKKGTLIASYRDVPPLGEVLQKINKG